MLFAGEDASIESVKSLRSVVDDYQIEQADLIAVIDGMESDAFDTVRMPDEAAFDLYLDQVACAVGRLSDRVFGLQGPHAEKLAYHFERAFTPRDRNYEAQFWFSRYAFESDDKRLQLKSKDTLTEKMNPLQ